MNAMCNISIRGPAGSTRPPMNAIRQRHYSAATSQRLFDASIQPVSEALLSVWFVLRTGAFGTVWVTGYEWSNRGANFLDTMELAHNKPLLALFRAT